MATKIKIRKKEKELEQKTLFILLDDFINDSYSGRRTKKNGSRISHGTIRNYHFMKKNLIEFVEQDKFDLKLFLDNRLTLSEKDKAHKYWRRFYRSFTSFLYDKQKYYDNYVGLIIKCLRSFFNYLVNERNIDIGTYHKSFYVPSEEISIITLDVQQLNYIIYDTDFNNRLVEHKLVKIRDIFVFGCTVALRVSDLLQLTRRHLHKRNGSWYLDVKSQKTGTSTSIKLPDYAVEIIKKYNRRYKTLLPPISSAWFNKKLKTMARLIPDNMEVIKTRERRGKQVVVYKDSKRRIHYKLSDHITTHTMRRTAITTMLNLGMPEHLVRKISGHAPNSKDFFRYVRLSQTFVDNETEKVFGLLEQKKMNEGQFA